MYTGGGFGVTILVVTMERTVRLRLGDVSRAAAHTNLLTADGAVLADVVRLPSAC